MYVTADLMPAGKSSVDTLLALAAASEHAGVCAVCMPADALLVGFLLAAVAMLSCDAAAWVMPEAGRHSEA